MSKPIRDMAGQRMRLYLHGHGDWKAQTLSGYDYEEVYMMLDQAGLKAVDTVSVLGCSLARDKGAAGQQLHAH